MGKGYVIVQLTVSNSSVDLGLRSICS